MTPAEHYAEAERLIGEAANGYQEARANTLAAAQVHATLANYRPVEQQSHGDAERHMAVRLGLTSSAVRAAAVELWGHALVDERNRRCPVNAPRGQKGHTTRQLVQELQAHLEVRS